MTLPTVASSMLVDQLLSHATTADRVWVLGSEAALAGSLAQAGLDVSWLPIDVRERDALATSLVRVTPVGERVSGIAWVAFAAPPDRELARRWIVQAADALVPGGSLLLAGANDQGIKSVLADAGGLFGQPVYEDYHSRHRIAAFTRGSAPGSQPDWAIEPGIAPDAWRSFDVTIGDEAFPLVTCAGVFARDKVDAGTSLLLQALPGAARGRVLDVGCGAGVLGFAASRLGADAIDLVDANLLAITAAEENQRRLAMPSVRVMASDVYSAVPGERYDLILSNPPFHRGKVIDFTVADRLITEAPRHLLPGGELLLVANAFLAYGKQMAEVFEEVETVRATRQYHVVRARNPRRAQ